MEQIEDAVNSQGDPNDTYFNAQLASPTNACAPAGDLNGEQE